MTTEKKLIEKAYYQTILDENQKEHPIKSLGEMFRQEMQKEQPELSAIRFAQGEVYFLNQDYEAAIYKWQHPVDEPLIPWAQKNIADAHLELGLFEYAESYYKEVETESVPLKMEVLLQLFSLYKQQGHTEKAVDTMKQAIALNPDYSDVTGVARRYFEEIRDWDRAVDLAVNEALRTESLAWFGVLERYASLNHTSNYEPTYFHSVLVSLLYRDTYRFERLTDALWTSYEQSDYYFQWLETINRLLLDHRLEQSYPWKKLPGLFRKAYQFLLSGEFLIRDISNLIPNHLTNWLAVSSASNHLISSTAILAWNERFPSELDASLVHEAEEQFENAGFIPNGRQEGIELWDSMKQWAVKEGLLDGLMEYIQPKLDVATMEGTSPSKVRDVMNEALAYMVDQRVEIENDVLEKMNWNEEVLAELSDFQQQIRDMEKENTEKMTSSFHDLKNKVMENVQKEIPTLLRDSTDLVKEDVEISKLHTVLNEEMNKRIAAYMETTVLPDFQHAFQEWMENAEQAFQESQMKCVEFSERMNHRFNEERLVLSADFQVLGDWERDIERTSRGLLRLEEVNIWLQNNPSQLLLKGAGKLFGSLSKNKDIILKRYKDMIEKADYREVAEKSIQSFIQQLDLFEESIEWDVNRFFSNPQEVLRSVIEEVEATIENEKDSLHRLRENPEIYQDPITLFELKIRQYELVNGIHTLSKI